jgi:pilus assembly protein CpaF
VPGWVGGRSESAGARRAATLSDGPLGRCLDRVADQLRERLIEIRRSDAAAGGRSPDFERQLRDLVDEEGVLLGPVNRADLLERVRRDTIGLGPLEELLADPEVDEVLVNGHDEVWVEREGSLERSALQFDDTAQLRDVIERILGPLGRRVDELSPIADGRLADGSRVNVVVPPLAVDGPVLSIRRFIGIRPGVAELVARGTLPSALLARLAEAVRDGRNLLISGGTGSGKTTVLNALSSFIPDGERVITIEDAAELQLARGHVVRLETRAPSVEGVAAVSIRDLVRNALRMRPDRILIGEVRGAEAMDLLLALNTGHRGALTTVHANSPADAIRRIEALAMMAEIGLGPESLRSQIVAALDLVLHLERGAGGDRLAVALAEVVGTGAGPAAEEVWAR